MSEQKFSTFLRPWLRHLRMLTLRKALLSGCTTGAVAFAATVVIWRLRQQTGWLLPIAIGVAVLIPVSAITYALLRPTA